MEEIYCNEFPQEMWNSIGAAVSARGTKWKVLTSASRPFYTQLEEAVSSGQFQTVPVEAEEA